MRFSHFLAVSSAAVLGVLSVAPAADAASASSASRARVNLTWPKLKRERTYTVPVSVNPLRRVDHYASSVLLDGRMRINPGFEQTIKCRAGRSTASVEVYQPSKKKVNFVITIYNGACTARATPGGAVPFSVEAVARYEPLPTAASRVPVATKQITSVLDKTKK